MMTGLFTVMCFITSAHAPEWRVSGDPAALAEIETQLSAMPDTIVRRGTASDGSPRLWFKLPGELHLRDIHGLFHTMSRGRIDGIVPPARPYFCPYGGADLWREGRSGPPTVGIFGTTAEIERIRAANPNWHYEVARNTDGRTGVHFTPGVEEDQQASYSEFLSQVHAEFEGIDVVLVEQVSE